MNLTFAEELTKMIDSGLGRETVAPDTSVAVGRYSEYIEVSDAALATFDTNAALPLRALSVNIEPIQAGTGDPSPENVRPITGRQNVTIRRTGENLLSPGESGTKGGLTFTVNSDGTVTVGSGKANASSTYALSAVNLVAGETYALSGCPSTGGQGKFGLALYVAGTVVANDFGSGATYTPTANVEAEVRIRYWYNQSAEGIYKPQLELGSAFTVYEPYKGQTVSITLGQTVYGGVLDVTSGTLTVDMAMVDLGSLNWTYQLGSTNFVADISNPKRPANVNTLPDAISSIFAPDTGTHANLAGYDNIFALSSSYDRVIVRDSAYTDAATFKTAVTGQQLVYALAAPVSIQLSAQQIETLIGANNVWSDGGNVSLTYTKYNYTEGY